MARNIPVGIHTVKEQCGPEECAYYEACQTFEGRREVGEQIVNAKVQNDPTLLPSGVIEGHKLKNRPDNHLVCMHLARLTVATVPHDDRASTELVREVLEWGVEVGFSKAASINQPRS